MSKHLISFLLMYSTNTLAGEFKSADEIIKKLSAYQISDITGDTQRLKNKEKLKIDEMFDDLEFAAKYLEDKKPTEEVVYNLERVCLLTFIHDPSSYSVDLIMSVYDKNTEIFKRASKKLHSYDQQVILEVLEGKSQALKDPED